MHFSIITITKDNPRDLAVTEQSVKQQIFSDYEWIVIDGAKEPDNGIYDAMNKGIGRARGDYIIFMNAGDQFAHAHVLSNIATFQADFIYGDSTCKKAKHHSLMPYGMITHHQAMVYRRAVIGDLKYDECYPIAADYKFTLQLIARANSVCYIHDTMCIFETGGISQNNAKQGRLEQIQIRKELGIHAPFTPYRQWCGQIIKKI